MSRDRLNLTDGATAEVLTVEDALYPCPKCGKGGSPAPTEPCVTCGQHVPTDDIHCPKCGHRYPRASVPVMSFVCRVCQQPGSADHYIENPNLRVHSECVAPKLN